MVQKKGSAYDSRRQAVFAHLNMLHIPFTITEHPAMFSIEDLDRIGVEAKGEVCKNLFLRDAAGKRHFLVVLPKDKKASLDALRRSLHCSRLGFASAQRLEALLGLRQGEVSPFGVLNDANAAVEVVFDASLQGKECLGVHPNDNTATVWLSFDDLFTAVQACGNRVHIVEAGE